MIRSSNGLAQYGTSTVANERPDSTTAQSFGRTWKYEHTDAETQARTSTRAVLTISIH